MSRIDAALPEQQQQEKKEADAKTLGKKATLKTYFWMFHHFHISFFGLYPPAHMLIWERDNFINKAPTNVLILLT